MPRARRRFVSISSKIGCTRTDIASVDQDGSDRQTANDPACHRMFRTAQGAGAGEPELRQANEILRKASAYLPRRSSTRRYKP